MRLHGLHGILRCLAEDPVFRDLRDKCVLCRCAVDERLQIFHIRACASPEDCPPGVDKTTYGFPVFRRHRPRVAVNGKQHIRALPVEYARRLQSVLRLEGHERIFRPCVKYAVHRGQGNGIVKIRNDRQ